MKKTTHLHLEKQPILLFAVIASLIAITGSTMIAKNALERQREARTANAIQQQKNKSVYEDSRYRFSVKHLVGYDATTFTDTGLSIATAEDAPWSFAVQVEPTKYGSTNTWVLQQPKGSSTKEGIQFLRWVDAGPRRLAVYSRFAPVDMNGKQPILGQSIEAAYIYNGKMYTLKHALALNVQDKATVHPDFLALVESFRITE